MFTVIRKSSIKPSGLKREGLIETGAYFKSMFSKKLILIFETTITPITKNRTRNWLCITILEVQYHSYSNSTILLEIKGQVPI